jgi:hypothetical protein
MAWSSVLSIGPDGRPIFDPSVIQKRIIATVVVHVRHAASSFSMPAGCTGQFLKPVGPNRGMIACIVLAAHGTVNAGILEPAGKRRAYKDMRRTPLWLMQSQKVYTRSLR